MDQVLIAFFFTASSVQQVGRSIVLQGFPVCFVAAAFDASGYVVAVIALSLSVVVFCLPAGPDYRSYSCGPV